MNITKLQTILLCLSQRVAGIVRTQSGLEADMNWFNFGWRRLLGRMGVDSSFLWDLNRRNSAARCANGTLVLMVHICNDLTIEGLLRATQFWIKIIIEIALKGSWKGYRKRDFFPIRSLDLIPFGGFSRKMFYSRNLKCVKRRSSYECF